MDEQEMRDRAERFLKRRLQSILMPSALGLGLAMTGGCRAHVQSNTAQTASAPADGGEPVEEFSDCVAIYSAPATKD